MGATKVRLEDLNSAPAAGAAAALADRLLPIRNHELRLAIGSCFAGANVALGAQLFLDFIPGRFGIAEPEGRLHVPLLSTPWSDTTYRDS